MTATTLEQQPIVWRHKRQITTTLTSMNPIINVVLLVAVKDPVSTVLMICVGVMMSWVLASVVMTREVTRRR